MFGISQILITVLVRVSIPAQNMTKKQVGEERVYSAYNCTLLFITKGIQDRNSHRVGTWKIMLRTVQKMEAWLVKFQREDYRLLSGPLLF